MKPPNARAKNHFVSPIEAVTPAERELRTRAKLQSMAEQLLGPGILKPSPKSYHDDAEEIPHHREQDQPIQARIAPRVRYGSYGWESTSGKRRGS